MLYLKTCEIYICFWLHDICNIGDISSISEDAWIFKSSARIPSTWIQETEGYSRYIKRWLSGVTYEIQFFKKYFWNIGQVYFWLYWIFFTLTQACKRDSQKRDADRGFSKDLNVKPQSQIRSVFYLSPDATVNPDSHCPVFSSTKQMCPLHWC